MILKRIKALAAAAVVCATAVAGSFAVNAAEMKINELDNMIVDMPAGYESATRSSQSDDKYFSVFGLDYDTVMQSFNDNSVYLQGMDEAKLCTITVTMTKTSDSEGIGNYKLLDVAGLAEVERNFLDQTEYTACTPDESGSVTWLNFSAIINSAGTATRIYQSNTIYDGMNIIVSIKRNTGDVIPADYQTLMQVVKSVRFDTAESFSEGLTFILQICATVVGAIVLIILIALVISKIRKSGKKKRNDNILDELAKKHITGQPEADKKKAKAEDTTPYLIDMSEEEEAQPQDTDEAVDAEEVDNYGVFMEDDDELLESVKEYRLKAQPIEEHTMPEPEEASDDDGVRIYEKGKEEKKTEDVSTIRFTKVMPEEEPAQQEEAAEPESEVEEATEANTSTEGKIFDTDEFETVTVAIGDGEDIKDGIDADAEEQNDDGYEDFMNDEELVREASRKQRFDDSYDFFDEAPSKTMGVISRDDVEKAEDFDVIEELEEKVMRVEKPEEPDEEEPAQSKGKVVLEKVQSGLVKTGKGIKSFFVHCGYFCTNVYRMIKHKKAVKKRKKLEAEKLARRQARLERERQARSADSNGLVQVRSRTQGRPSSATRSGQKRPSGRPSSAGSQRRPSQRPTANGQRRRPTNSRPPQKRR